MHGGVHPREVGAPYWSLLANLRRGLGNSYKPHGAEVLISAVAHNTPPPFQAAQNATTVNTRSSVAPCIAQRHTSASPEFFCSA